MDKDVKCYLYAFFNIFNLFNMVSYIVLLCDLRIKLVSVDHPLKHSEPSSPLGDSSSKCTVFCLSWGFSLLKCTVFGLSWGVSLLKCTVFDFCEAIFS